MSAVRIAASCAVIRSRRPFGPFDILDPLFYVGRGCVFVSSSGSTFEGLGWGISGGEDQPGSRDIAVLLSILIVSL